MIEQVLWAHSRAPLQRTPESASFHLGPVGVRVRVEVPSEWPREMSKVAVPPVFPSELASTVMEFSGVAPEMVQFFLSSLSAAGGGSRKLKSVLRAETTLRVVSAAKVTFIDSMDVFEPWVMKYSNRFTPDVDSSVDTLGKIVISGAAAEPVQGVTWASTLGG